MFVREVPMFWLSLYDSELRSTALRKGDGLTVVRIGRMSVYMTMWRELSAEEVRQFTVLRIEHGRRERMYMGPSPQQLGYRIVLQSREKVLDSVLRELGQRLPELKSFTWRKRGYSPVLLLSETFIAT